MEEQRAIFIKGAKEHNNIDKKKADEIFKILEKFAQYGFNKSHSAAYAFLSYRTAYLKANYPVEFMAAVLSNELGNSDKVAHFVEATEQMGILVQGPDINASRRKFTPVPNEGESGAILFGLAAIKGVSEAATEQILAERDENGPFESLADLLERVESDKVNKRVMEHLVKTGAFDRTGQDRAELLADLEPPGGKPKSARKSATKAKPPSLTISLPNRLRKGKKEKQGLANSYGRPNKDLVMPDTEKLEFEKDLLGFFVSGHPLDAFGSLPDQINTITPESFLQLKDMTPFRICGVINGLERRFTRKDNRPQSQLQPLNPAPQLPHQPLPQDLRTVRRPTPRRRRCLYPHPRLRIHKQARGIPSQRSGQPTSSSPTSPPWSRNPHGTWPTTMVAWNSSTPCAIPSMPPPGTPGSNSPSEPRG